MGKKTRSGKDRRKKRLQQQQQQSAIADHHESQSSQSSSLIQRLRHADPPTRLAALNALEGNPHLLLLCSNSVNVNAKKNHKNNNNDESRSQSSSSLLLDVIRERLFDDDIECCIAAAGCLSNYLNSSSCSDGGGNNNNNNENNDRMTATASSWMPLFLRQIQNHCNTTTATTTTSRNRGEFVLIERCMECICYLIENNPIVMERLLVVGGASSNNDELPTTTTPRRQSQLLRDLDSTLRKLLPAVLIDHNNTIMVGGDDVVNSNNNSNNRSSQQQQQQQQHRILVLITRCLHSAWDDNPDLLRSWIYTTTTNTTKPTEEDPSIIMKDNNDKNNGHYENDNDKNLMALNESLPKIFFNKQQQHNDSDDDHNNLLLLLWRQAQLHAVGAWSAWYKFTHDNTTEINNYLPPPSLLQKPPTDHNNSESIETNVDNAIRILSNSLRSLLLLQDNNNNHHHNIKQDPGQAATAATTAASAASAAAAARQVQLSYEAFVRERDDSELERTIVRKQEAKKEPAREIARRLRQQKDDEDDDDDETTMNVDDDDDDDNNNNNNNTETEEKKQHSGKLPKDRNDAKQTYQDRQDEWTLRIHPVQLALEIVANLTTTGGDGDGGITGTAVLGEEVVGEDEDEDDVCMVDAANTSTMAPSRVDPELVKLLVHYEVPQVVHSILVGVSKSYSSSATTNNNNSNNGSYWWNALNDAPDVDDAGMVDVQSGLVEPPAPPPQQQQCAPILESTGVDLVSKAALCEGHLLLLLSADGNDDRARSTAPTKNDPSWPPPTFWNDLKDSMQRFTTTITSDGDSKAKSNDVTATTTDSTGTGSCLEALSGAMVVALRSQSKIRRQVGADDLDYLLGLLMLLSSTSTVTTTTTIVTRDVICMLGILCSEQHSAAVNERVCRALLQAGASVSSNSNSSSWCAMVLSEVLNVVMDLYGDDECHATVFDSCQVLTYFEKTVPVLQRKIRASDSNNKNSSNNAAGLDNNPDEIEQWNEIAWNAQRFIDYKKGLC